MDLLALPGKDLRGAAIFALSGLLWEERTIKQLPHLVLQFVDFLHSLLEPSEVIHL